MWGEDTRLWSEEKQQLIYEMHLATQEGDERLVRSMLRALETLEEREEGLCP
jgi:hypothetical protein